MNVLQIIQASARLLNQPVPSAYNGNAQLLECLDETSRELRALKCFPQQKQTHSFTTTAARSKYPLPANFYSALLNTHMDQTRKWRLRPISDSRFNYKLYGPGSGDPVYEFRIFGPDSNPASSGGQFELYPTPASTDTISYDYIAAFLYQTSAWSVAGNLQTPAAGTDLPIFDDQLLITGLCSKYLEMRGLDNSQIEGRYRRGMEKATSRYDQPQVGRLSRRIRSFGRRYFPADGDGGWSI